MPEQPTHIFFNSRCAEYKTPFGAVPAGQTVTWRLTVPERLGYVDPHLVLTKDREDPVHYRMNFDGQTPGVNHFVFQLAPTTSGLYFYHFDLYTDFRKIYRTANGEGELTWVNGLDWQLTVYEPDFKTPDWIKDGTMYQIFPDRFYEGVPNKPLPFADRIYRPDKTGEPYFWPNEQSDGYLNMDYYGGDFAGIQQKLPYLEELGVTCIYLNPIFEAHANHRYNTANYLKADPLLGTNEDFAALCAEAQADMADNNAYWKQWEGPVKETGEKVYTAFLQGYGQKLGMRSYGACVDLLVEEFLPYTTTGGLTAE